jgi:hypothetical protein
LVGDAGTVLHYDDRGFHRAEVPSTENLNGIWGDDSGDLWVAGDAATLLHFDGQSWSRLDLPLTPQGGAFTGAFSAVSGHGHDLWLAAPAGQVVHYDGSRFTYETTTTRSLLRSIWAMDTGDVIAVGDGGAIVRRTSGTWATETSGTGKMLFSVRGTSPSDIYAAGNQGTTLHYDGKAWQDITKGTTASPTGDARALVPDANGGLFWFGSGGSAFYRKDGDWRELRSGLDSDFLAAASVAGRVLGVGANGAMVLWDGASRTVLSSGSPNNYLALSGATDQAFPLVIGDGMQVRSANGWSPVPLDTDRALYGITFTGPGTAYAVGTGGTILQQHGNQWSLVHSGSVAWLRSIWSDGSAAWAVGAKGTILALSNGSFSPVSGVTTADLYDIWGASSDAVWAVGEGELLRCTSGKWERFQHPGAATIGLRAIWGASASDAWAVGARGTLVHFDGTEWSLIDTDHDYSLNDVWGVSSHEVWAVGTDGIILKFDGTTWAPEASGSARALNAVWAGKGNVWAVGEAGTVLRRPL